MARGSYQTDKFSKMGRCCISWVLHLAKMEDGLKRYGRNYDAESVRAPVNNATGRQSSFQIAFQRAIRPAS